MLGEFDVKLLDLTRNKRRWNLEELSHKLQISKLSLRAMIQELNRRGFLSVAGEEIELDTAQRMRLAEFLIDHGRDPHKISRFLEWQEFEDFAVDYLERNGYRTFKHLVFKSREGRREIDLLAWNDNFLLVIDCKHWLRGLSSSQVGEVAKAQSERTVALAKQPRLLLRAGVERVENRNAMPMILCLSGSQDQMYDGVPIVPVLKLISFLYGVSPIDERFRWVRVKSNVRQSVLT